ERARPRCRRLPRGGPPLEPALRRRSLLLPRSHPGRATALSGREPAGAGPLQPSRYPRHPLPRPRRRLEAGGYGVGKRYVEMSLIQPDELLKELAVALYARDALSFSKACELSKLNRVEFGQLLVRHEVPRHYGEEELERDRNYASSGEAA